MAPGADWGSSCSKLLTEEILAGRTWPYKKKKKIWMVSEPYIPQMVVF